MKAQTFGTIKDFRVAQSYDAPHESQRKTLIEGLFARKLPDSLWALTNATVQTYRLTGERELIANTPACFYNQALQLVTSPGPLEAQLGDGSFTITGMGFRWEETNASLIISNQVHTVIHPKTFESGAHREGVATAGPGSEVIEIFSGQFAYTNTAGLAFYRDNVRVTGTNFGLTSELLTADLPIETRSLRSVTADRMVAIDYTNAASIHATGQHAVYTAGTGLIRLTGNPTWRSDQRLGHGDELVIDRSNKVFDAVGHAWLRTPAQNSTAFAFLSDSNNVSGATGEATNRFIEVASHSYRFRTNSAVFQDDVCLTQFQGDKASGTMNCSRMTAWFAGSNQLDSLVAETNVVIQGETNRMTAGKAVFTATNGWLELTEHPTWKSGEREGSGQLIRALTRGDEVLVRGDAFLRMPANDLATPEGLGTTNKIIRGNPGERQFAEVTCRQYTLRKDNALFEEDVHVHHPQMSWSCQRLEVLSVPEGKVMLASGGVGFDLKDEKGQVTHGAGDTAVYTNTVTRSITNNILYLRGNKATLTNTDFTVSGATITWDLARNLVSAPGGDYRITGTGKAAPTNMIRLPKSGGRK